MCLLQWYVISLSELSRTNNVCPAEIPEQLHSGCERFYGLKLLLSLLLLLLSPRSSLRSPGQQAVGDLSSEADCQGGSARGESHVSHLRLLKRARNVQDPHQLQGGAKQLDDAHSANCGEVPEFNQRRSQKKKNCCHFAFALKLCYKKSVDQCPFKDLIRIEAPFEAFTSLISSACHIYPQLSSHGGEAVQ